MIIMAKIKMTSKMKQILYQNLKLKKLRLIKILIYQIRKLKTLSVIIYKHNHFSNHLYHRMHLINPNRSVLRL
jgi:hypothetical protein